MRKLMLIALLLVEVMIGCSKTNDVKYLQKGQVNLVQPRLQLNNSLIDSFVELKAELKLKDVSIYYTDNGENPTNSSIEYTEPIRITTPGTYKFRAYHSDWKPSNTSSVTVYKKGVKPSKIEWNSKIPQKYQGQGKTTLINEQKGTLNFTDQQWMGFDSIANAEVTFDKMTFIKSIDIGYLQDISSWIFPPEHLELILFRDAEDFEKIQLKIDQPLGIEESAIKNIHLKINKEVTSILVRITNVQSIPNWHDGKGTKAWLFMDEWIFNI